MHLQERLLCLVLAVLTPLTAAGLDLEQVLANMDRAASGFAGMEAGITRMKYMALLEEKTTESGEIYVRKDKSGKVRLLINFREPYNYHLAVSGDKAEIYRPRIATVEEYSIAKHRDTFQQAFLLGFGTTADYLRENYELQFLGEGNSDGQPAVRLELIPKSEGMRKQVPKLEMWVSTETWQAVRQKLHQPGGEDYRVLHLQQRQVEPEDRRQGFQARHPQEHQADFPATVAAELGRTFPGRDVPRTTSPATL